MIQKQAQAQTTSAVKNDNSSALEHSISLAGDCDLTDTNSISHVLALEYLIEQ